MAELIRLQKKVKVVQGCNLTWSIFRIFNNFCYSFWSCWTWKVAHIPFFHALKNLGTVRLRVLTLRNNKVQDQLTNNWFLELPGLQPVTNKLRIYRYFLWNLWNWQSWKANLRKKIHGANFKLIAHMSRLIPGSESCFICMWQGFLKLSQYRGFPFKVTFNWLCVSRVGPKAKGLQP